ncbi:hypothetical protein ACFXJ8_39565 [Nonomuraea sp. NPDC059194]|uniref:hypothetical protein n=1 Tax=Nonomuraea sp. NPDC059194 TaxID=3346764 RepID=UPI0036B3399F
MKTAGYALGGALILLGFGGLILDADRSDLLSWALWFGGVVVAHDLVIVPLVLAAGLALRRLRLPYRVAALVGGLVTIVALPMVLGFGRRADNPSQLPLDYPVNLAVVLLTLVVLALVADVCSRPRDVPRR